MGEDGKRADVLGIFEKEDEYIGKIYKGEKEEG